MNDPVPVVRSIEDLYTAEDLPAQKKRFDRLLGELQKLYHQSPHFVARSPGRVNIIGEHIDYSLYEVLPMAIAADVLIAVVVEPESNAEGVVSLANLNPGKFKPGEFKVPSKGNIEIDSSTLQWTNYFKAGFHGAVELLLASNPDFKARGMKVLIDGTVPAGGGLSSSAAFVCASALAVLRANGQEQVIKKELVERAIVSERSVGVNSGGMDQSASVFSIRGDAVSVTFSPSLRAEAIRFPSVNPPITFMIAQSFVTADKHVTAPKHYNLRVVECTLAAEVLAAKYGVTLQEDHGPLGRSLRGFQLAYFSQSKESIDDEEAQLRKLLQMLETLDRKEGYTREEISRILKISVPDLEKRFMSKFPVQTERFLLRQRAEHVYSESLRVIAFKRLLQSSSGESGAELLSRLGALMNETQTSCREVYDCSCPELDQLCGIARDAGAYGSRLTGAGWGGCTVHLVPKDRVKSIEEAWLQKYYKVRDKSATTETMAENSAVVVSDPGHGSMVIDLGYSH